ncbi:MAG: phosphoribosyltransferase family protein [Peptococcaceae bacterium]|nr:phosphoribosyltransferase family protein [Peptococcaceae bacterium]
MKKFHEVEIAGLKRQLPLYQIDEDTMIPLFIAYNDVPLIQASAEALLEKVPDFDCIVTEELQGISLAYAMTLLAGKERFVVARKSAKAYMDDVVAIRVVERRDDEEHYKRLYLSKDDAEYVKNKRILLVDDVVLHGTTMTALADLTNALGGYVVGEASIIRHGFEANDEDDYMDRSFLLSLPLFSISDNDR